MTHRILAEVIGYVPDDPRPPIDQLAEAIARQEFEAENSAARRAAARAAKARARRLRAARAALPKPWIDGRTAAGRAEAQMLRARGKARP